MKREYAVVKSFLQPYRSQLIIAAAVTVVISLLTLMPPLLVRYLVDKVITPERWDFFWLVVAGFVLLPILRAAGGFVNTFLLTLVGQKFVFDLRTRLYSHIANLSERFFQDHPAGLLLNRIMTDTSLIQSMVTGSTVQLLSDIIYAIFAIAMIFYLDWQMSLLVIVVLPLYLLNFSYFKKRIRLRSKLWLQQCDELCGFLQERIHAITTVKSFGREYAELQSFIQHHTSCHDLSMARSRYAGAFTAMAQLITGVSVSGIYCLGCYRVLQGRMGYGDVIAFVSYASMLFGPMVRISNLANLLVQTSVSLERIFELLDAESEVKVKADAIAMPKIKGRVRFDHVWFAYEPEQFVLKDIDLDIESGTNVALVGHTGCGKSTITNMLLRNFDPNDGAVLIDGVDLRDVDLDSYRRQIAMVFQDSIVFHATVRENIAYGLPEATDEQIEEACRVAELHDIITRFTEGYNTKIGEGGVILSLGEKQRLSIARAVLIDPKILILDEATSSVDPRSELQIKRAMDNVMKNRTTFVIAHRLSTIVNMDLILVLEAGRIVERGTHEELVAREGYYWQLFNEQTRLMPTI